MKLEPRKVYAEVYKQDCFECKRLEEKTLNHPEVAEYINSHFYAIRLNADSGDTLMFRGKKYGRLPEAHTHALAWEWTRKKNSYPASVYFDEQFKNPMPVSGYMDVTQMEMMLKYVADNLHKSIPFDEYKQHFKGSW